jgi:PEP-CTERM motif
MRNAISKQGRSAIVAAGLAVAWALTGSAHADVIESSPNFPPIPLTFTSTSPTGAGCFDIAMVCVTPGTFTLTSAMSTFPGGNQEIVAQATYGATLTPLPSLPPTTIGSVALTGTVDETVFGRMSNTETGTFPAQLTSLDLTGQLMFLSPNPLEGATLLATLDPSEASTGTVSIKPISGGSNASGEFRISSFFDIFIDVSIPSAGLSKSGIGPIPVAAGTPEPSTWAMMLIGFGGLAFAARRRAAAPAG